MKFTSSLSCHVLRCLMVIQVLTSINAYNVAHSIMTQTTSGICSSPIQSAVLPKQAILYYYPKPITPFPSSKSVLFAESTDDEVHPKHEKKGIFARVLNMFKPKSSEKLSTKELLAKMGLSALLSYGFVSNFFMTITVSLAWFTFSKKTAMSPLAPGQWKRFLAVYTGFYVFNNIIRPFRFGLSVGIAKYFDAAISWVQNKLNVSKPIAIGIIVFFANILGTCSLLALGILLASTLTGVPIFPAI